MSGRQWSRKEKAPGKSKSGLYKDKVSESNIRWRISCLKLGWIMGGLGEWDAEEGEEDTDITTQIFRYKRSNFLHQHWHKWAKRIIQLVWNRAFIRAAHKKYAFNQNSYGILFSLGVIEWLIISMHSTVSPTWYAIIVVIIKHSDQTKSLRWGFNIDGSHFNVLYLIMYTYANILMYSYNSVLRLLVKSFHR